VECNEKSIQSSVVFVYPFWPCVLVLVSLAAFSNKIGFVNTEKTEFEAENRKLEN
jgi:hypothetical protein